MEQSFDLPPDSGAELAALLERSGVDFSREGDQFQFRFTSGGCIWQTVCRCRDSLVLIYGIHPVPVEDTARSLALCNHLNSQVVHGSFFLQDKQVVFRTSAQLTERFEAQAQIAAALEYNASAISHWWERLAYEAQGSSFPLESESRLAGVLEK